MVNGRNNEILAASEYLGDSPNKRVGPGQLHVANPQQTIDHDAEDIIMRQNSTPSELYYKMRFEDSEGNQYVKDDESNYIPWE